MVEMSPRALTMRLLALRDALGSISRTHDLDVAGMVMEQPSLATLPGDADDSVWRAWRVLEATFPDVDLAERAQACLRSRTSSGGASTSRVRRGKARRAAA